MLQMELTVGHHKYPIGAGLLVLALFPLVVGGSAGFIVSGRFDTSVVAAALALSAALGATIGFAALSQFRNAALRRDEKRWRAEIETLLARGKNLVDHEPAGGPGTGGEGEDPIVGLLAALERGEIGAGDLDRTLDEYLRNLDREPGPVSGTQEERKTKRGAPGPGVAAK